MTLRHLPFFRFNFGRHAHICIQLKTAVMPVSRWNLALPMTIDTERTTPCA
jgi:hypothetical protein